MLQCIVSENIHTSTMEDISMEDIFARIPLPLWKFQLPVSFNLHFFIIFCPLRTCTPPGNSNPSVGGVRIFLELHNMVWRRYDLITLINTLLKICSPTGSDQESITSKGHPFRMTHICYTTCNSPNKYVNT